MAGGLLCDALSLHWRLQRIRVPTHDLHMAAVCVIHTATLISRNRRDFVQIPGLRVEF
jgi:tRNA(fMet)-specific endonuclease VapC